MAEAAITAIRDSRPPTTDYMTYLTIIESHLSPELLPALNDILQDAELTQNIGWDLIQMILPLPGSEACLTTIARLGNPREVVLKVTEALSFMDLEDEQENAGDEDEDGEAPKERTTIERSNKTTSEPTTIDKFCTLLGLLAILHPRIKTKYPSRFLSTSLVAVLSAFRPTPQATHAVTAFIHTISGHKRPMLPQRQSSFASLQLSRRASMTSTAPDPEASEEDPNEKAIQKKLLQSFVTHVLEEFVKSNGLEWAARLQEHFEPSKVIPTRKSWGDCFRDDPALQERDICVGELVARARDLGLSGHAFLFESLDSISPPSDDEDEEENSPSSPEDIPLSRSGCLFLVTSSVFGSIMFDTKVDLPPICIFPDHTELVKHFLGVEGPTTIGTEDEGVIDAILALGLWLEHSDSFVKGPLEDEDYLQELQTLSLLSANSPSSTLRYHAHLLTSSILHAHPVDRTRLTFINDTLEHCPYENLKGSAVSWLKEEIILSARRKSSNVFSSPVALAAVSPYLFPDMTAIAEATESEIWDEIRPTFPFHMAVLNFLVFVGGKKFKPVVPPGMLAVAEEIYLEPMRAAQLVLETALGSEGKPDGALKKGMAESEVREAFKEVELLGERLVTCLGHSAAE